MSPEGSDAKSPELPNSPGPPASSEPLTAAERETRRRRLAEVFGEELPDQTSDDVAEPEPPDRSEEWLRRQVPPHHG